MPCLTPSAAELPHTPHRFDFRNDTADAFLKSLNDGSVDLVLTDPPYLISRETGFANVVSGEARLGVSMDFGKWDTAEGFSMEELAEAIREMHRILRPGGTVILFFDFWKITPLKTLLEEAGFRMVRMIEWLKTNPVPLNSKVSYLTNAREIALCAVKGGKPTFDSEYDDGTYFEPICRDRGRFHPTQKPVNLMRQLVLKHSRPGDLVVDPFAGSATTGVAALRTGRRFAGCEPDADFFARALDRLTHEDEVEGEEAATAHRAASQEQVHRYAARKMRRAAPTGKNESSAPPTVDRLPDPTVSERVHLTGVDGPPVAEVSGTAAILSVSAEKICGGFPHRKRRPCARLGPVESQPKREPQPAAALPKRRRAVERFRDSRTDHRGEAGMSSSPGRPRGNGGPQPRWRRLSVMKRPATARAMAGRWGAGSRMSGDRSGRRRR